MIMNILLLALALAQAAPVPETPIAGVVAETMDSGGYTYVRLLQGKDLLWVAIPPTKVEKGQKLSFQPGEVMRDFESKTLKRTFPSIIFSPGLAAGPAAGRKGHGGTVAPHGSPSVPLEPGVKIAKAEGADAYTVAEVHAKRKQLEGKTVSVRGKVVKARGPIMDMNWVHLQDGSGDAKAGTHDLTVTMQALPKASEVITVKGKARADRQIGPGYFYPVLVEEAVIVK